MKRLFLLALCAANCTPAPETSISVTMPFLGEASCPPDTIKYAASPLDVHFNPVPLGVSSESESSLPKSVKFVGGWHLTSTNSEFGGLSGLQRLPNGDLLTVSDRGYFISIGASFDGVATMQPLLDSNGKVLTGKASGDAEGLAYKDGLVFVSFERKHRVLAYNLDRCGVAARGIKFAGSPEKELGQEIGKNVGAESLDVTTDGRIRAGYETVVDDQAPLITFENNGSVKSEVSYIPVPSNFKLVGADKGYHLLRAYDRDLGNRNIIRGPDLEFRLEPPMNVDNFEGLTAQKLPSGKTRLYLISDDNYSARQRTLLYIFDIED